MTKFKKVLIFGAEGYKMSTDEIRINCFTWRSVKNPINISDYDYILINLLSIANETIRESLNWDEINSVLNIKTIGQTLKHQTKIVILGDPRFNIPDKNDINNSQKPFLDWTGMLFEWDDSSGDTLVFSEYHYKYLEDYIKKINKWKYSVSKVSVNQKYSSEFFNLVDFPDKQMTLKVGYTNICRNRINNGLIFSSHLYVTKPDNTLYSSNVSKTILNFGEIYFLPPIEALEDETILLALYRIFGIEVIASEPTWLKNYKVPKEEQISGQISEIESNIFLLKQQLQLKVNELINTRRHLKLLYSREFDLEPIVREVFDNLGANVQEPTEKNKEDGWISVTVKGITYEGVIEIKSTRSTHFSESGIRQLLDWIQRGINLKDKKCKGIFIGNNLVDLHPKERNLGFSDSWIKNAKLNEICALTSVDLYVIYTLWFIGKLDIDNFWETLFKTNGVFDTKKYWDELDSLEGSFF